MTPTEGVAIVRRESSEDVIRQRIPELERDTGSADIRNVPTGVS
jgi:hypothetical protein